MTEADAALVTALRRHFPDHDPVPLAAMLRGYGEQPHHHEPARVRLAIIELCHGDPARLPAWLAVAKEDYRDVLAALSAAPPGAADVEQDLAMVRRLIDTWGQR